MALFIALRIVSSRLFIPVSDNLRIGISYLVAALEASILGPAASCINAFCADILSSILFPDGPFFIGYTLTAILGSLIYALFFYKQKITILKITIAKILNNYLINVLLGSLWSAILYSRGYYYYFIASLIKNTILLPFEILLLVMMFQLLKKPLMHYHLIEPQNTRHIPWK